MQSTEVLGSLESYAEFLRTGQGVSHRTVAAYSADVRSFARFLLTLRVGGELVRDDQLVQTFVRTSRGMARPAYAASWLRWRPTIAGA